MGKSLGGLCRVVGEKEKIRQDPVGTGGGVL